MLDINITLELKNIYFKNPNGNIKYYYFQQYFYASFISVKCGYTYDEFGPPWTCLSLQKLLSQSQSTIA